MVVAQVGIQLSLLDKSVCSTTELEVILPGPKAKAHHLSLVIYKSIQFVINN
jgi:hypothetical protein